MFSKVQGKRCVYKTCRASRAIFTNPAAIASCHALTGIPPPTPKPSDGTLRWLLSGHDVPQEIFDLIDVRVGERTIMKYLALRVKPDRMEHFVWMLIAIYISIDRQAMLFQVTRHLSYALRLF